MTAADSNRIGALTARAEACQAALKNLALPSVDAALPPVSPPPIFSMLFGFGRDPIERQWSIDRRLETLDAERARLTADSSGLGSPSFDAAEQARLDEGRQLVRALPQGTVALYYLTSERRLDIVMVASGGRRTVRVDVDHDALDARVRAFRKSLQEPARDPLPEARQLHDLLIAPVASALAEAGAQTLMLSLDGQLRYLPFAALHDGRQWLVERYALELYTTTARDALLRKPTQHWRVAAFGNSAGGGGFPALPAVRKELDGIVRDASADTRGVLPGVARLDREFTAAALRDALRTGPNVIHVASHFAFRPGDAERSYLLLGDGTHLSLAELTGYRFDQVDLVTLSACQTGLSGDDRFGQEVEGLGSLLQAQGAAAVLASLWTVADDSTAQLMRDFYGTHERRGLSRAEALRAAQLGALGASGGKGADATRDAARPGAIDLDAPADRDTPSAWAGRRGTHPYFWAPFVLMGNWL